jgi:hypothetical protein
MQLKVLKLQKNRKRNLAQLQANPFSQPYVKYVAEGFPVGGLVISTKADCTSRDRSLNPWRALLMPRTVHRI